MNENLEETTKENINTMNKELSKIEQSSDEFDKKIEEYLALLDKNARKSFKNKRVFECVS